MHYWLDYRIDEIAEILGMPSGTVKSHLHRGRSRLAARLKEQ
jgi:DNA-directed RNA polymerase specialized sigma24 family protein